MFSRWTVNRPLTGFGLRNRIWNSEGRGFCTKQRVKSMPPLSTYNCFEVLANISDSEATSLDMQKTKEIPFPVQTPTPSISKRWKLKWEKALPEKLTIATTEGTPNSLSLKMEIETTNTAEKKSITALVDSRAMGEFIDRQYAGGCRFDLIKLTQPIPVICWTMPRDCWKESDGEG